MKRHGKTDRKQKQPKQNDRGSGGHRLRNRQRATHWWTIYWKQQSHLRGRGARTTHPGREPALRVWNI